MSGGALRGDAVDGLPKMGNRGGTVATGEVSDTHKVMRERSAMAVGRRIQQLFLACFGSQKANHTECGCGHRQSRNQSSILQEGSGQTDGLVRIAEHEIHEGTDEDCIEIGGCFPG